MVILNLVILILLFFLQIPVSAPDNRPSFISRVFLLIQDPKAQATLFRLYHTWENFGAFRKSPCWQDIQRIWIGLKQQEDWALRIFDSSFKFLNGHGLAEGSGFFHGSLYICKNISSPNFRTQFGWLEQIQRSVTIFEFCFPETCNFDVINNLFTDKDNIRFESLENYENRKYDLSTTVVLSFCFFLVLMVILGTLLHFYLYRKTTSENKQQKKKKAAYKDVYGIVQTVYKHRATEIGYSTIQQQKNTQSNDIQNDIMNIFLCFSAMGNVKKLLQDRTKKHVNCLDGIRSICMLSIVYGHVQVMLSRFSDNSRRMVDSSSTHPLIWSLLNSKPTAVDTFFTLSGLLLMYSKLTQKTKQISVINTIWNRYLRLSPAFYFCSIFIKWVLISQNRFFDVARRCLQFELPLYLYVNTYFPSNCLSLNWYNANEMQFHIVGSILIYSIFRWKFAGFTAMAVVFLCSVTTTVAIIFNNDIILDQKNGMQLMENRNYYLSLVYTQPYCRIGPFIIGLVYGWIFYRTEGKVNISKAKVAFLWLLCVNCLYWPTLYLYHFEVDVLGSAIFTPIRYNLWALGICILIFLCSNGYGGIINDFLAWDGWRIFSRLSYCNYLIHSTLIALCLVSRAHPVHYTLSNAFMSFLGFLPITFGAALLIHLTVEAPAQNIINVLKQIKKRKRPKKLHIY